MEKRINYVNEYLKEKFGERTLKICIDGGFTCPNRDGTKSNNGCIFCGMRGSGEHLLGNKTIKEQIKQAFSSIKIERANCFIIYFQNYTNTYKPIEELKKIYDEAIISFNECAITYNNEHNASKKLVGLQIATRPDCINDDIASLLSTYTKNLYVAVELGFQTACDEQNFLNRCYSNEDFEKAISILNNHHIDTIVHIMVGLPTTNGTETHEDIKKTISFLNKHKIQGIKIHSCYVIKGTGLEELYLSGKYIPITLEAYLDELTYILTHISKDIIVHRISGDAPKDILVAPSWNTHKKLILNGIYKKFENENLYQGMFIE